MMDGACVAPVPGHTEQKGLCLCTRCLQAHSEIQPQLHGNAQHLIFGCLPAFLFADVGGVFGVFFFLFLFF